MVKAVPPAAGPAGGEMDSMSGQPRSAASEQAIEAGGQRQGKRDIEHPHRFRCAMLSMCDLNTRRSRDHPPSGCPKRHVGRVERGDGSAK
eukprot:scaffold75240_cov26-Tisochrysis_lutea.AAC.3